MPRARGAPPKLGAPRGVTSRVKRIAVLLFLLFPSTAAAGGPAAVRVADCVSALETSERHATFAGDMRAVPGTARMQMRFTLMARINRRDGWARVAGGRLGTWVTSYPGKVRYVYDKRVAGLLAPADYRVRVRFRWVDADG